MYNLLKQKRGGVKMQIAGADRIHILFSLQEKKKMYHHASN